MFMLATTASAQAAPNWYVNGTPLAAGTSKAIEGEAVRPVSLTIPSLGEEIDCQHLLSEGEIVGGAPGTGSAVLNISGCNYIVGGETVPSSICQVSIAPMEVVTELYAYAGQVYETVRPRTGPVLTTLTVSGANCAFAMSTELTGSVVMRDPEAGANEIEHTSVMGQALSEEVEAPGGGTFNLMFGECPMFLNGSFVQALSSGDEWSIG